MQIDSIQFSFLFLLVYLDEISSLKDHFNKILVFHGRDYEE
jgi:hypothetical protein